MYNVTDDLQLWLAGMPQTGPNCSGSEALTSAQPCHGLVAKQTIPATLPDPLMVARGTLTVAR